MWYPTRWTAKNYAATTGGGAKSYIWSADGLKFQSMASAMTFIGLKKGDPSLTDEMCNAMYHKFPEGWKAMYHRGDQHKKESTLDLYQP